jgi:hypothetical protein
MFFGLAPRPLTGACLFKLLKLNYLNKIWWTLQTVPDGGLEPTNEAYLHALILAGFWKNKNRNVIFRFKAFDFLFL